MSRLNPGFQSIQSVLPSGLTKPSETSGDWTEGLINPNHANEWLASGVAPEIVAANVRSLEGAAVYDYLFYAETLPRTNNGRIALPLLKTYACLEEGGWWCSGLDPLECWRPSMWGQFKPDRPRLSQNASKRGTDAFKPVKYEPPPKVPTRAFFLAIPDDLAETIYQRSGVDPAPADRSQGFWHCVWAYNIPIVITEGAKKAGALLTSGYAAIALPGISNGYRSPKNKFGERLGDRHLIPDLDYFAQAGRMVYFCFDHDTKPTTQAAVRTSIAITGQLFVQAGCQVKVIQLPGPEKGVDDFIQAHSAPAFDSLYHQALTLGVWQAIAMAQFTYPATVKLHAPFLGKLPLPDAGLVCLKSPKGTGKTTVLEPLVQEAMRQGRRTLLISHRIQLGQATCDRLGIDYINSMTDPDLAALFGLGLCVDSLHPNSQARFQTDRWDGAVIVLDECEQLIWHMLNSATCQKDRVAIIQTFQTLIHQVLSTKGLIIVQDADLSDYTVDLLLSYANMPITPWVLINTWKPQNGWETYVYDTPNPGALWLDLAKIVAQGSVFICSDSQKSSSKWGTTNIEAHLSEIFPDKKILRIDSTTVSNVEHPAYGCVHKLNEVLPHYDIVIASPSVGSGVSIDLKNHFKAVFGIFQGTIPDNEARQALARVREPVPRYVWAKTFGVGKIANGACDYHAIASSTQRQQQANLRLLREIDFDIDGAYDPITFRTWAKLAARVNASLFRFREVLYTMLAQEGHHVHWIKKAEPLSEAVRQVNNTQSQIRDRGYHKEAQAIAEAADITPDQYQRLKEQRVKTPQERHREEKHRLQQRYGIPITPEIFQYDQNGWYTQLQLHYYLTHPFSWVTDRDRRHWRDNLHRGNGKFCPQDLRTYSEHITALRLLKIDSLLDPDQVQYGLKDEIQTIATQAVLWRSDIKTLFGINISAKQSPMHIIQSLLGTMGLKLERTSRSKISETQRCWHYRYINPNDPREEIFALWRQKDIELRSDPASTPSQQLSGGRFAHDFAPRAIDPIPSTLGHPPDNIDQIHVLFCDRDRKNERQAPSFKMAFQSLPSMISNKNSGDRPGEVPIPQPESQYPQDRVILPTNACRQSRIARELAVPQIPTAGDDSPCRDKGWIASEL